MAEAEDTVATSVHDYVPSLWHVVGQFPVRVALTALVDQFHTDTMAGRWPRYPVVLITGKTGMGRRHLAQALHHAFGNTEWKEPAHVLGTGDDAAQFWASITESSTIFVPHVTRLPCTTLGQVVRLIRDGCVACSSPAQNDSTLILNNLIVLSAEKDEPISNDVLKHVTLRCDLTPYTNDHIFQILRQRVTTLNWHASDETLRLIAQGSKNSPAEAMTMLQYSYMCWRAEDKENAISVNHAKKAVVLNS